MMLFLHLMSHFKGSLCMHATLVMGHADLVWFGKRILLKFSAESYH